VLFPTGVPTGPEKRGARPLVNGKCPEVKATGLSAKSNPLDTLATVVATAASAYIQQKQTSGAGQPGEKSKTSYLNLQRDGDKYQVEAARGQTIKAHLLALKVKNVEAFNVLMETPEDEGDVLSIEIRLVGENGCITVDLKQWATQLVDELLDDGNIRPPLTLLFVAKKKAAPKRPAVDF
jgi:hypothetical protein